MPWSIPARAGRRRTGGARPVTPRVDPRVCGGAAEAGDPTAAFAGLSPRVRGSLSLPIGTWPSARSIPALAGLRRGFVSRVSVDASAGRSPIFGVLLMVCAEGRVHPRVIGDRGFFGRRCVGGRSPRLRGAVADMRTNFWGTRFIPACAGEPGRRRGCKRDHQVYPRVCGGALHGIKREWRERGLSPRVRGSRPGATTRASAAGSIPARAG